MNHTPAVIGDDRSKLIDASSWILTIITFFLPLFFVPVVYFPVHFSKIYFLTFGVVLALVVWLFSVLKNTHVSIPRTGLVTAAGAVLIATTLSALFAETQWVSFVGVGSETGTVVSTYVFFALFFLVATIFNTRRRVFNMYLALFTSFFIVAVYHGLRFLFGGDFLDFGIFTSITSTPIGGWYDLAVYFGLFGVFSLIALEILALSRVLRLVLYAILIVSLFFLAVANFVVAWMMMAGFSLLFFVYLISFNRQREDATSAGVSSTKKTSGISIVVLIISIVFIIGESGLGAFLSEAFNTSFLEVRPSWDVTLDVVRASLADDMIFGSGPNTFREQWLMHKPDEVNQTIFWNTDFTTGNGFFPTVFATSGILGILAWIAFIGLFIVAGIRAVLTKTSDTFSYYVRMSSFIGALYLWMFAVRYNPSIAILALAMILTGLFVASLSHDNLIRKRVVSFSEKPKVGFFAISGALIVLIFTIYVGYHITQRYIAQVVFQKAIYTVNIVGEIDQGRYLVERAYTVSESDVYARSLVEIDILELNTLLSESNLSTEESVDIFQETLSSAISNAQNAVRINERNYQNLLTLGRVYEAVLPLEVNGAYENAVEAYRRAEKVAPTNPSIALVLARLERANGDIPAARAHILRALEMKSNYTEAIFLQSQIEAEAGNIRAAIRAAEDAAVIAPDDESIFFQLGILKYNDTDFAGAVNAFARAVKINPEYANAKYFLGLSLYEEGERGGAIQQFEDLARTNSANQQIQEILANLRAGKAPISVVEEEDTLPIDETVTTTE